MPEFTHLSNKYSCYSGFIITLFLYSANFSTQMFSGSISQVKITTGHYLYVIYTLTIANIKLNTELMKRLLPDSMY